MYFWTGILTCCKNTLQFTVPICYYEFTAQPRRTWCFYPVMGRAFLFPVDSRGKTGHTPCFPT